MACWRIAYNPKLRDNTAEAGKHGDRNLRLAGHIESMLRKQRMNRKWVRATESQGDLDQL